MKTTSTTNQPAELNLAWSLTVTGQPTLGLGLLFPKYYLIFHSEFLKLLPYYSLRVHPLFHKILLTVSQK